MGGSCDEFGSEAGRKILMIKVLYGLKISGAAFREFLADTLYEMVYRLIFFFDPDIWLRPAVKPDGFYYCKYILCCVDNVLCISHNPRKLMGSIQDYFNIKDKNVEPPNIYIGELIPSGLNRVSRFERELRHLWASAWQLQMTRVVVE